MKVGSTVRVKVEEIATELRVAHGWSRDDSRVIGCIVAVHGNRIGVGIHGEVLWFYVDDIEMFNAQMSLVIKGSES